MHLYATRLAELRRAREKNPALAHALVDPDGPTCACEHLEHDHGSRGDCLVCTACTGFVDRNHQAH